MGHETLAKLRMRPLHDERIGKKLRAHTCENRVSESGSAPILHRVQRHARDIGYDLAPEIVSDRAADSEYLLRRPAPFANDTQVMRNRERGTFEDRSKQMRFRGL